MRNNHICLYPPCNSLPSITPFNMPTSRQHLSKNQVDRQNEIQRRRRARTIHPSLSTQHGYGQVFPRTHHVHMFRAISIPISVVTPDFCYRLLPGGCPTLSGGRPPHPIIVVLYRKHGPKYVYGEIHGLRLFLLSCCWSVRDGTTAVAGLTFKYYYYYYCPPTTEDVTSSVVGGQ